MHDQLNERPPAPELSPDELCTVIEFEHGTPAFEEADA